MDYFFNKDHQYVLNRCTTFLSRYNIDARHSYGPPGEESPRDRIAEAWRFPIVDTYGGGAPAVTDPKQFSDYNEVTFVYAGADTQSPASVAVIGTFSTLYEPLPLQPVQFEGERTRFWSLTYVIPKGQRHLYRFIVDGAFPINDPVNPQLERQDNGQEWSRFFTDSFSSPLEFEAWEFAILYRLAAEILPFQTGSASNFLARFYDYLDRTAKENTYNNVYRLDDSVGEVNYIDNILAREERHHLTDYKICLRIIDRVLRQRNPYMEPDQMSREIYFDLYNEMAANHVAGWDYSEYSSPQFFLYLLRRHVVTGAFCHPKYGGNAGGAGWAYLSERYTVPPTTPGATPKTLFDWRISMEPPLGNSPEYLG